jgi:RNA polymerase sigma-70 factor (ECF subfamily)
MNVAADRLDSLLAATRNGDQDAYHAFLVEAAARLRAFAARRMGGTAELEDVVQDCLIALHEKRGTLDPDRPVAPWMYAIARYKLADYWRGRSRRGELAHFADIAGTDNSHAGYELATLLDTLPAAQAEAIRLTRIEGLTMEEAAARTGAGVSSLKQRVARGMTRLRHFVTEKGS